MTHGGHYSAGSGNRFVPEIRRLASAKALPIALGDIKEDLRVDSDDEDKTVARLARAAASFFEIRTGCVTHAGRFEARLNSFPSGLPWEIRRWPLRSVEKIQYLKDASTGPVWTDVPLTRFFIDPHADHFQVDFLKSSGLAPTDVYQVATPIKMIFTAGFDTVLESGDTQSGDDFAAGEIEQPIDDGIRNVLQALIAHYYENRELFAADKAAEVEASAGSLLNAYRQFW